MANLLVDPKTKPKVSSGSPTVGIPGQGQTPNPSAAATAKAGGKQTIATAYRTPEQSQPATGYMGAAPQNQNNVFGTPSPATLPNGSGPGTGVSPGGASNGSMAPPGGKGLPGGGGGMSPPSLSTGQQGFSAPGYQDPGSSAGHTAFASGVAANTTVGQPVGTQGMWDNANQTGMDWFSQGQQLTSQLPGTNTLGGFAPSGGAFSAPQATGGSQQAAQNFGAPAGGNQPTQVAGTFGGPANQPAAYMGGIGTAQGSNIPGMDGQAGGGSYLPGNPMVPGSDQGFGNPGGAATDAAGLPLLGTDSGQIGSDGNPVGTPGDIYGPGGMEGPFNNPDDPTVPADGPVDINDPSNWSNGTWVGPNPGGSSSGSSGGGGFGGAGGLGPGGSGLPPAGGGMSGPGGTFVGTDPATGDPIFSGPTGGSSSGGPINPATGSPASNPSLGGFPTNGGSGSGPVLNPPAIPPSSGGGGVSGGSSSGASGGGGSNVASNTNNLTFQAPKAVGQQSESFSEDYGEGGGKSQSQNSSSSSSHSENKSENQSQSTSTGRAQDKSQSLSQSSSDAKHTFDPSQAKDFVGDVAREKMPDSPFSQQDAQRSLNQANARVAAGSAAQLDKLNAQLGGAGFDPNSAAGRSLAQQIMRDRLSQEVQNSVNIPMEFAQKHGSFEQANAGMNVDQRGQDLQREGMVTSIINQLLGQQASQSQGQSLSEGFSNQDSQSTSTGSSSGFADSLAGSQGWSESEDWRKNQGKSGSYSVPVFA